LETVARVGARGLAHFFFTGFLAYAWKAQGGFLFIDGANPVIHEGEHNVFGWFGSTIGLWGDSAAVAGPSSSGRLFPCAEANGRVRFLLVFLLRELALPRNLMADAGAQALPLVTTGDPDFVEHDLYVIFSSLGVLNYDTKIAALVRVFGWCGMPACVGWLAIARREA
jgi:hypothetical protein